MVLFAGIACGLSAAIFQSVTYLLTRHYAEKRAAVGLPGAGKQLLVLGHVWMGLIALGVSLFCWPAAGIPWAALWLPLLGNIASYCVGQLTQVIALRHAEASRVGPMMTAKLIPSSILVMLFGQQTGASTAGLTLLQWIAIPICLIAGLSINFTGGRMKPRAVMAIAIAAISFAVSDYCITLMIRQTRQIPGLGFFHAALLAGLLSYLTTGLLALPLLLVVGSRKRGDWLEAIPYACVWFSSMVSLYSAFAFVGILLGQILQCTRGFITIVFGAALMRLGYHHIEPRASRRIMMQRLGAGLLMFAGICLYVLRDSETIRDLSKQVRGVAVESAPAQSAPGLRP